MNENNKRIIKFRAWDEHQKYMTYQGKPDLETIQSFMFHFGDKSLMQFIGLKDRNNQEIYEGDIINFETYGIPHGPERDFIKNAEVYYDEKIASFCFGRFNSEDYEYTYQMTDRIDEKTVEVVGNIFEKKI